MYTQDEKRIRDLYGPKPQPEFTIRLNNELIDKELKQTASIDA